MMLELYHNSMSLSTEKNTYFYLTTEKLCGILCTMCKSTSYITSLVISTGYCLQGYYAHKTIKCAPRVIFLPKNKKIL